MTEPADTRPPKHSVDDLPAWCFAKFDVIEQSLNVLEDKRDERFYVLERKIDRISEALTGDVLHPNGLVKDIAKLKTQIAQLDADWQAFLNRARGFGIGIALGAGAMGGGVAAVIGKLLS